MSGRPQPPAPAPRPGRFPLGPVILVACLVVVGLGTVLLWRSMQLAIARSRPGAEELPRLGAVPPFALVSEQGKDVGLEAYRGKVWIADFIFTSCGSICPAMTQRMKELTATLSDFPSVRFVSFSVDPETDTVEVLAAYGREHGADPSRWSFLRGERDAIRSLSRDGFKLPVEDAEPGSAMPILHSPRFVLVDEAGGIRGYYDSSDPDAMKRLAFDARMLATAAGTVP